MSIRQVNGSDDSGVSTFCPPLGQSERWTGSRQFPPTNGWKETFLKAVPLSPAMGARMRHSRKLRDGGDLAEHYSKGRSQVSADPSPSMWRASSSLNRKP